MMREVSMKIFHITQKFVGCLVTGLRKAFMIEKLNHYILEAGEQDMAEIKITKLVQDQAFLADKRPISVEHTSSQKNIQDCLLIPLIFPQLLW
jgi:hypothetical protein